MSGIPASKFGHIFQGLKSKQFFLLLEWPLPPGSDVFTFSKQGNVLPQAWRIRLINIYVAAPPTTQLKTAVKSMLIITPDVVSRKPCRLDVVMD